jgi:tetratricopeptide (TPR) repeat protein
MSGCGARRFALEPATHQRWSPQGGRLARPIAVVSCLFVAVSFPAGAAGQPARDMIGERVVQKSSELTFRVGETRFSASENVRVYRVVRAEGPWLWLKSEYGSVQGWASADDVIPVDEAVDFFTALIAKDPRDAFPYAARARIRQDRGKNDLALDDYTKAIELNANRVWFFFERATLWCAKQSFAKARADYDEVILRRPGLAEAYLNRGETWRAEKQHDKAIADYNSAIRLNPGQALFYFARGCAWRDKSQLARALSDFDHAIRLDPNLAVAYAGRGGVRVDLHELDQAFRDCARAIKLDPRLAAAYTNRSCAWLIKNEYEKAIDDLSVAIRLDPTSAESLNNCAWLMATCPDAKYRDGQKAVESAKKACELTRWGAATFLDTLSAAYAEAGQFDEAVKTQEQAIGLLTTDAEKADYRTHLKLYAAKRAYHK